MATKLVSITMKSRTEVIRYFAATGATMKDQPTTPKIRAKCRLFLTRFGPEKSLGQALGMTNLIVLTPGIRPL